MKAFVAVVFMACYSAAAATVSQFYHPVLGSPGDVMRYRREGQGQEPDVIQDVLVQPGLRLRGREAVAGGFGSGAIYDDVQPSGSSQQPTFRQGPVGGAGAVVGGVSGDVINNERADIFEHGKGYHKHHKGHVGPVYTFVKTDYDANFKWGVRHVAGKEYGRRR